MDGEERLAAELPPEFSRWSPLCQDQYLEMHTLLSGYLLCSQGDRMLMAHSVEGRFPFLDRNVVELAASLPSEHKLFGLDEKHVVKRAALGVVPDAIRRRRKQPYRAPDALSFVGEGAPDYVRDVMSASAVENAGVFDPVLVGRLVAKCFAKADSGQLSNADNMAFVGVLSAGLLHEAFVKAAPTRGTVSLTTDIDRVARP